jgi:ABC-type dipeptide/oligopeptide/nickel transport system permease subunit
MKGFIFGSVILTVMVILALVAPLIYPLNSDFSPLHLSLSNINLKPGAGGHILGTDYLGRDLGSLATWGARATLTVGVLAALLAVSFGSLWGSFSAFAGGIVDNVMMRIVDGLLSIPNIILLLALNSIFSTPSLSKTMPPFLEGILGVNSHSYGILPLLLVVVVITATSWLEAARITRAKILAIKSEEYLIAAKSLGEDTLSIIIRHLLPNAASVILVEGMLLVSDAILMESGLSFLGLGIGPATPSWGTMLSAAQLSLMKGNWWAVFIPGLLITLTVMAVNLIGEGVLDLFGRPTSSGI